jgi:regulator of protease activity HflC (stomatin/prohibitin superfamily)
MKRLLPLLLLGLGALTGCNSVPPGHVVMAVDLSTSDDASRYSIIHGGRYWPGVSPNTDYYEIPVMEQRSVWSATPGEGHPIDESISFAGVDGQVVNVDIGLGYQLNPDDAAIEGMVRKYGPVLHTTIDGRVRDTVRNSLNICAGTYTVEQIYGADKGELLNCALEKTNAEYEPNGLKITRLTLNSEVRLPPKIKVAMESANAATQQANQASNEVAVATAEGQKRVAAATADAQSITVTAQAQAEANRILAASITPELIKLKEIEVQRAQAEKWNGVLPTTVMGGATPFVQLKP